MHFELPSPIEEITSDWLSAAAIRVYIKRDDLIHPEVSGNKWRKLQYNLVQAKKEGKGTILTFGGAFSNHIYATAAAGKYLDFPTIGLIRGEATDPLNATLSFAQSCGMKLYFVTRSNYRDKKEALKVVEESLDQCYLLPEGGTNSYALPGCGAMVAEVQEQLKEDLPDYWCLSCGTGGTMAGILSKMTEEQSQVIGFSALKGDFHQKEIKTLLRESNIPIPSNWEINTAYHFGGYARHQPSLIDFINNFKTSYGIQLDPIYTGKLFYGIFDLIKKGYFKRGSKILVIHTGGLQGITGFKQRFGEGILK